jgi:hypothetical protein
MGVARVTLAFCDTLRRKWLKKHAPEDKQQYFQLLAVYQPENCIFWQLIAF